ncbi:hypothetical protein A2U01_0092386, partial [Trifolium medium]|nr:hypothetical protein [Trifolium medium]
QCVGVELLYPRNVVVADHGVKVHPPISLGDLLHRRLVDEAVGSG